MDFNVPSECADRLESGAADVGIVPTIELPRLDLEMIPGTGIIGEGAVRSILLFARKPFHMIETLAADSGSRSSVALARILLAELHGATPRVLTMAPRLEEMLGAADAALLIGDSALRADPMSIEYDCADLGAEWTRLTGLPMVFAVWAARAGVPTGGLEAAFAGSYQFGRDHMDEIIQVESGRRDLPEELVRDYLTTHVRYEVGERERKGMEMFLNLARKLDEAARGVSV
jgi:predicted solute-binding protein